VSYFYNHASEDDIKAGKKSIGVIAQEHQLVNPHCVLEHTNLEETKNLGIAYQEIFLHNINATKELHQRIVKIEESLNLPLAPPPLVRQIANQVDTTPPMDLKSLLERIEQLEETVEKQQTVIEIMKKQIKKLIK
jgi:hypothetical protein